jgi:hypothetical protein
MGSTSRTPCKQQGYIPTDRSIRNALERVSTRDSGRAVPLPGAEPSDRCPEQGVVGRGAAKSGTRIAAERTIDLGLDVFAVPGPVTSPLAETPLGLIATRHMIQGDR